MILQSIISEPTPTPSMPSLQVNYFLLRGEPVPRPPPPAGTADDVADIRVWTTGERSARDVVRLPNVHEQVCAVGACRNTNKIPSCSILS